MRRKENHCNFLRRFLPRALLAAFFALIAWGGVYAASPISMVVLYNGEREIFRFSPPDGRFTVRFTHSWARTPVDEIFQVSKENGFILTETIYEDFGAGLAHDPESDSSMTIENGIIHIRGINRAIPDLQIRTGRVVAAHTLIYGNRYVPFSDFAAPGSAVIFRVENNIE